MIDRYLEVRNYSRGPLKSLDQKVTIVGIFLVERGTQYLHYNVPRYLVGSSMPLTSELLCKTVIKDAKHPTCKQRVLLLSSPS